MLPLIMLLIIFTISILITSVFLWIGVLVCKFSDRRFRTAFITGLIVISVANFLSILAPSGPKRNIINFLTVGIVMLCSVKVLYKVSPSKAAVPALFSIAGPIIVQFIITKVLVDLLS